MDNPFIYGEIVPGEAFADREAELERLVTDLGGGQKVFLISPRRYGKSSLVHRALSTLSRHGALTVNLTVSSYSSYVAFLEGYAKALATVETKWQRAKTWLTEAITSTRPELMTLFSVARMPPLRSMEKWAITALTVFVSITAPWSTTLYSWPAA